MNAPELLNIRNCKNKIIQLTDVNLTLNAAALFSALKKQICSKLLKRMNCTFYSSVWVF